MQLLFIYCSDFRNQNSFGFRTETTLWRSQYTVYIYCTVLWTVFWKHRRFNDIDSIFCARAQMTLLDKNRSLFLSSFIYPEHKTHKLVLSFHLIGLLDSNWRLWKWLFFSSYYYLLSAVYGYIVWCHVGVFRN